MEIADRITVLRRGRVIAHLTPSDVESRRELARLMVGREVVLKVEKKPTALGEAVLELRDCSGFDERGHLAFHNISFAVRRGEIFSIIGVAGNGQAELVAAIMGLKLFSSGEILLFGKSHQRKASPPMEHVGYIPEDRMGIGSIPNLSLLDNLILTSYPQFYQHGFQTEAEERGWPPRNLILSFLIGCLARQLSGGNLQKLILARNSLSPKLIVAGSLPIIDIVEEVWMELLKQREEAGILLISGDLKEVLSLSDRIGVIFRGRLMGIFSSEEEDWIGEIGPMMAGVRKG
jgi:simple sugar transport system ATP-binding protein